MDLIAHRLQGPEFDFFLASGGFAYVCAGLAICLSDSVIQIICEYFQMFFSGRVCNLVRIAQDFKKIKLSNNRCPPQKGTFRNQVLKKSTSLELFLRKLLENVFHSYREVSNAEEDVGFRKRSSSP